jgi:hypothetical protein
MADTVSTQVLADSARNYIVKLTSKSDGTGESAVKKIDLSTMHPVPTSVRLDRIEGDIAGMEVELLWEATINASVMKLAGPRICMDFKKHGGIPNTKASGWTGNVMLTTSNQSAGDSYSLVLHFVKKFADSSHSGG